MENSTRCAAALRLSTLALSSSAQFFVAMGLLTIIYVVGALLVYVMFITPELFLAKWLVIGVGHRVRRVGVAMGVLTIVCGGGAGVYDQK